MTITDCYAGLRVRVAAVPELPITAAHRAELRRRLVGQCGLVEGRTPYGLIWLRLDSGSEAFLPADCLRRAEAGAAVLRN
jgi:hypothetical protein